MSNCNKSIFGIIWMLIFCLLATIADGIVRYVTIQGFPSSQILFIRCFLGTIILLPLVIRDKSLFVSKEVFKLYVARGIFSFLGAASWFYCLKYVDFTAIIAIGFTSPLFVTVLAICFLKEKISGLKLTALLIGFSGAMIVVKPFDADFNIYLSLAVASAFVWAISLIFTKKLSDNQKPTTVAFFFALILTPLSFFLALPFWQWPVGMEWLYILLFVGVGTMGQISLTKAFSYANIATLMPFEYSGLVFATIFSYIVFGDLVTLNTLVGGMVILGSGYIIIRSEGKKKHRQEELDIIP